MKRISMKRHVSKRELEGRIREEREKRVVERLIFIRDLYEEESVERAAGKQGRAKVTGTTGSGGGTRDGWKD